MSQGSKYHDSFGAEKADRFNRFVSGVMQDRKIPGLAVTLVKGDEIVFSRGYGYRDLEKSLPASDNTLFGVGSVSKSFTGVAILQLAEKGKLKLDDPVTKYLDDYRVDEYAKETTISHMLSHASGFPTLNAAEILLMREIGRDSTYIPMADRRDFFDLVNSAAGERMAKPGKAFFYWNEGYTVLGYIVEKITGKSFVDYMRENVLKPLGMDRSTYDKEAVLRDSDAARAYYFNELEEREPVDNISHPLVDACGGVISSSHELSLYLRMWMGSPKINNGVLSAKSIAEGIKPRIKTSRLGEAVEAGYGYGWANSNGLAGHNIITHSGSTGVSAAHLAFVPEFNIGVAVTSNRGDCPTGQIGAYALMLLAKGIKEAEALPYVRNAKLRKMLKGRYDDFRGFTKAEVFDGSDGLLNLRFESDEMKYTVPLIVENGSVYTVSEDIRMPVEIKHREDGGLELLLERHRLVRK